MDRIVSPGWENNQPPHGRWLVQLARIAEGKELKNLAAQFIDALQRELASDTAATKPELKAWLEGLQIAFRYRSRRKPAWQEIAKGIIDGVLYAAQDREELSGKVDEWGDLYRQLKEYHREYSED